MLAHLLLTLVAWAGPHDSLAAFVAASRERHGEAGERAARFLLENMPERDRDLDPGLLAENLDLAFVARAEFPWAAAVPEDLFLNDVLPYAVFDEPRDPWRAELLELARPIVAGARTAGEAAQALNARLFQELGLRYHTGRERANQSFAESRASGQASCTGLSIVLVQACRAVGVPARAAGTPMWTNLRGNHTWVEVWDGRWQFTGAGEHDPAGLDRGWFVGEAAQARTDVPEHRIYATSWRRTGLSFPLAWSPAERSVASLDVTARYAGPPADRERPSVSVSVREVAGGERLVARLQLVDAAGRALGTAESRAGTADLNDMPSFDLEPGAAYTLRVRRGSQWRTHDLVAPARGPRTLDLAWADLAALPAPLAALEEWLERPPAERGAAPDLALDREGARLALGRLWQVRLEELRRERASELEHKILEVGGVTLRWRERRFGDAPEGRRSLWISMHGGGGAPAAVNDQQWQNQLGLYEPAEGFYVAPRAPTDTWNLWHQDHIDPLFQRLIEGYVALAGVDPDRVYLLGYSAGGDGVWQLAPRMADRFAAAAMMAGHPNEAQLHGLRNLPFALFMGAEDSAYERNRVARERAAQLAELRQADPEGYEHLVRIYEGLGHWMQRKDAEALPWMAPIARRAWPERVVWFQDDVLHERFYWLALPSGAARVGQHFVAEVEGQTVRILAGPGPLELRLSDELLDLDRPVRVERDGELVFEGSVRRTAGELWRSLTERADPRAAASARLTIP